MSARRLPNMTSEIVNTRLAINVIWSLAPKASMYSFPRPLILNMVSVIGADPRIPGNDSASNVTMGINAFLSACFLTTTDSGKPLPLQF